MKKIVGASALVLTAAVVAGASAAPAMAAEPAKSVTLKGHVRTTSGDPIKGVEVDAGGELGVGNFNEGAVTDKDGRYVLHIRPGTLSMLFSVDPDSPYVSAVKTDFSAKAGKSYRIDRELSQRSEIAGTIVDETGAPVKNRIVLAYDVKTGRRTEQTGTNAAGRYDLIVPSGSYKIRIAYFRDEGGEWLGDATTRTVSPTVTVPEGGKTPGINATVAPYVK